MAVTLLEIRWVDFQIDPWWLNHSFDIASTKSMSGTSASTFSSELFQTTGSVNEIEGHCLSDGGAFLQDDDEGGGGGCSDENTVAATAD